MGGAYNIKNFCMSYPHQGILFKDLACYIYFMAQRGGPYYIECSQHVLTLSKNFELDFRAIFSYHFIATFLQVINISRNNTRWNNKELIIKHFFIFFWTLRLAWRSLDISGIRKRLLILRLGSDHRRIDISLPLWLTCQCGGSVDDLRVICGVESGLSAEALISAAKALIIAEC